MSKAASTPRVFQSEVADEVTEVLVVDSTDLLEDHALAELSMLISGRSDPGLALVEVGATQTTERDGKVAISRGGDPHRY